MVGSPRADSRRLPSSPAGPHRCWRVHSRRRPGAGRRRTGDEVTLFSSSWKDRPPAGPQASCWRSHRRSADSRERAELRMASARGRPSNQSLGGQHDVAHSPHPLLLPSRSAAQLVTIHDLHFMAHPERTSREIRRDYPALARSHARRADRVVVSSRFAAGEVQRAFGVPPEKIAVCPAGGVPDWARSVRGRRSERLSALHGHARGSKEHRGTAAGLRPAPFAATCGTAARAGRRRRLRCRRGSVARSNRKATAGGSHRVPGVCGRRPPPCTVSRARECS